MVSCIDLQRPQWRRIKDTWDTLLLVQSVLHSCLWHKKEQREVSGIVWFLYFGQWQWVLLVHSPRALDKHSSWQTGTPRALLHVGRLLHGSQHTGSTGGHSLCQSRDCSQPEQLCCVWLKPALQMCGDTALKSYLGKSRGDRLILLVGPPLPQRAAFNPGTWKVLQVSFSVVPLCSSCAAPVCGDIGPWTLCQSSPKEGE